MAQLCSYEDFPRPKINQRLMDTLSIFLGRRMDTLVPEHEHSSECGRCTGIERDMMRYRPGRATCACKLQSGRWVIEFG